MKITIIIPAYNEERRIGATLEKVLAYLGQKKISFEIIVVDDGSQDKTLEIVRKIDGSEIKILENKSNRGKGYSVKRGMLEAQGDWILFTDADLSTPIEELEKFLRHENFDILIASRDLPESKLVVPQPWHRKLGGRLINFFVQALILPGIKDTQCGFKLFRQEAAKKIFPKQTIEGFGFDIEILYIARKLGFKIKELPVAWLNNPETKVRPIKDGLKILQNIFQIKINDRRGRYN